MYQYPVSHGQFSLEIPLTGSKEQAIKLPGGCLTLREMAPVADTAALLTDGILFPAELYSGYSWWKMDVAWQGDDPERLLAAAPVSVKAIEANDTAGTILRTEQTDTKTGDAYSLFSGVLFGTSKKTDQLTLEFSENGLCYRWNHPMEIPVVIPE